MPCRPATYGAARALTVGLAAAAVAGDKPSTVAKPSATPTQNAIPQYYYYNLATHEAAPAGGIAYDPEVAWDNSTPTGAFTSRGVEVRTLDWGDVAHDTRVVMFQIAYFTNSTTPITIDVGFFANDDGWNSTGRTELEFFSLTGLPVSTNHAQAQYFVVDIDLRPAGREFVISGADLDGDNRADFSYTYRMRNRGNATLIGMGAAFGGVGPVVPPGGPGVEDFFDRFTETPAGSGQWHYDGTFRFGGPPLDQYHMRLYGVPEELIEEDVAKPIQQRTVRDPP
jgi:hypothetical protein